MAQAELHMRGFFSHPPLVGAAGRIVGDTGIQGSHPGPSLWVLMFPVYFIGGSTAGSLMAAVVSVHLVFVAGTIWLAWRRGGPTLAWLVALGSLVVIRASGPAFMVEPWNPWLAVLPFTVFLLLVLDVIVPVDGTTMLRRKISLAGAVVVGSHCVQCHAGYLVLVAVTLSMAVLFLVRGAGWRSPDAWKGVAASSAIGLVMWLPVLIDQVRREPGNLSLLWQHFGSPNESALGFGRSIRVVAEQFNLVGPWLTGPGAKAPSEGWLRYPGFLAMFAVIGVGVRSARRRGETWIVGSLGVVGVFVAVGALSVSRIFGPFFEYTIRWFWILTMASVVLSLRGLIGDRHMSRRAVVGAFSSLLLLSTVSSAQAVARVYLPGPTDSRIVGLLAPQLDRTLDGDAHYLVKFWDPYTLNATGFGVVLELERMGFTVGVESQFAAAALPHRVVAESDVDRVLWVVVGAPIERARLDPDLTEIASADPRTPEEQVRASELIDDIRAGLERTGRVDLLDSLDRPGASLIFAVPPLEPDVAVDVSTLILLGQPVSVFSSAPGVPIAAFDGTE